MRCKKGISCIVSILLALSVSGQQVDPEMAQQVARRFFIDHYPTHNSFRQLGSLQLNLSPEFRNDTLLWYRIDVKGEGFVFVSGDVRCTPVLAYGYQPAGPGGTMPEACNEWFQWYARQIMMVQRKDLPATKSIRDLWTSYLSNGNNAGRTLLDEGIDPLTVSNWGQRIYYNAMCPEDPQGPGGHAMAGCVATAMAQVLFYYRFPEQGEGEHGYNSDYGYEFVDFGAAEYRWDRMVNRIHYWPNSEIANLIYHVGVSVEMNFGPNSSGALTVEAMDALRNHFRYNPDMNFISKFNLGAAFKDSVILNLDQHRILLYRGGGLGSSHSFVCDGYQDTTYFHFNWGWDGNFNGFYTMENLNPHVYDLTFDQEAVINIYPREDYPQYCQGTTTTIAPRGTLEDGSGPEPYTTGQTCNWLIQPENQAFTNIRLWFTRLDTEYEVDVIRVFDGPDNSSPLLGTISGTELPENLESTGNELFLEFESGSGTVRQGWQIEYFAYAGAFCNPLHQIHSMNVNYMEDGSGPYDYINGSDCGWLLSPQQEETDSIGSVDLYFHWFNVTPGDTLFIYDGPDKYAPVLGQFSGSEIPDTVHSTNNNVFMNFVTDESVSGPGWAAGYRSKLPVYCHDTLLYTDETGIISDGSEDKKYTPNTNCFWRINTENTEYISFEFLEFDLEYGYDQVKFFDASNTPPVQFAIFWGHTPPEPFFWYTDDVLIQFTSDESEQFGGWTLQYKAVTPGIHEQNVLANTSLYPNPVTNRVYLVGVPPGLSPFRVEILDIRSTLVKAWDFSQTDGKDVALNINGLHPGVYFVRLNAEETTRLLKLIIQ